jgi:phosphoglycerate dehydrogenase-like enzyme
MGERRGVALLALAVAFGAGQAPAHGQQNEKPKKLVVSPMPREQLDQLRRAAPSLNIVVARGEQEALRQVTDADGVYGFTSPEILRAGTRLKWVQIGSAGVEKVLSPEMLASPAVLTNAARVYGPEIADHTFAMLLAFTRGLRQLIPRQSTGEWRAPGSGPSARQVRLDELQDKTMLIVGLGGIGTEVARRAAAFGMSVLATDPKEMAKPAFVAELAKPARFHELLPRADVLVSAVPLTRETEGMIGEREFGMMKRGAYLINVSRGGVVDTAALVKALKEGRLAGAGLDVTEPEPLPTASELWAMENVIITPHIAGQSPGGRQRLFELLKENVRRFGAGEPLLNVVDKQKGY